MGDMDILDAFTEGFAKTAEAAGFHGVQVQRLMELSVDLAQREAHADEFDAGFRSVIGG